MTILVAGGTGMLGSEVVRSLALEGRAVRVLTRDLAHTAHLPASVEIIVGDIRRDDDVTRAVRGCSAVVSAVHGFVGPRGVSPESIDRDGNIRLIRASKAAGVARFVLLSVFGARADHEMSLHRMKHAAERALVDSGLPHTIVRPSAFIELWSKIIGNEGSPLVFGPGAVPVDFVSIHTVAPVVVAAVDDSGAGVERDIHRDELVSLADLAARVAPGKIARHIPLPMLRLMSVVARPLAPSFARQAQAAVIMNRVGGPLG